VVLDLNKFVNMSGPFFKRSVAMPFFLAALLIFLSSFGGLAPSSLALETNYQNPVTAAPPLSVPNTPSCTETLISNYAFGSSGYDNPAVGTYTPPSGCTPPWSMIVLTFSGNVAGRQFDRETEMWLGGAMIYMGTTPEPTQQGISWKVQKDVSEYYTLFTQPEPYVIRLPNFVGVSGGVAYTGVEYITVTLTFYETSSQYPEAAHPDAVIGISNNNWIFDGGRTPVSASPVTLPRNIDSLYLELWAKGNSCDEFWYASQPDAYASANGLCGGGAFREIQVSIDGKLAGVVWPFPYIFTGGINPLLWRPIPAVGAFNEAPYVLDLTPFVGMLTDGKPHTISFTVVNNGFYWQLGGNLLVHEDPSLKVTTGALTVYNIAPEATQSVSSNVHSTSASFDFTASRTSEISGYVITSQGKVTTTITQAMSFTNDQVLNLINFLENLKGTEDITTATTVSGPSGTTTMTVTDSYPISMSSAFIIPVALFTSPNPNLELLRFNLPATVTETFDRVVTVSTDGTVIFSSSLSDTTSGQGVLAESLTNGNVLVASGQDSEHYIYSDSTGACYNHYIAAAQGFVNTDHISPNC
jgi:hypothetical protein